MRDQINEDGMPRLSPIGELELMDVKVEQARVDEQKTMFDPDTHPKDLDQTEEAVTNEKGDRTVDLMSDTPSIDDELEIGTDEDDVIDADTDLDLGF